MNPDDDFLWAIDQVSHWLHDPLIDWTDREAARAFYGAVIEEAAGDLKDVARIRDYAAALVERGRQPVKQHRQQWSV